MLREDMARISAIPNPSETQIWRDSIKVGLAVINSYESKILLISYGRIMPGTVRSSPEKRLRLSLLVRH